MKLLVTGGSGFLGRSIIPFLSKRYNIKTLGIEEYDDHQFDLCHGIPSLSDTFEIVVHAAGKAHTVPTSPKEEEVFFNVNVNGTKNLCRALEKTPPKAFIFISTVAVYGVETGISINETHPLNGSTPYAVSKIEAETFLTEWCQQHQVALGIIRPSLIAGKNPPGNLGAMIKGIESKKYFQIGDGEARKSVMMAEDLALIIPRAAEVGGIYNVCDNHHPSFAELEELITKQLNLKKPKAIPYWVAKGLAIIGDLLGPKAPINSSKLNKITKSLTFSNEKAKKELNWEPMDVLQNFVIK